MAYFVMWAGALYPGERTRRLETGEWGGLEAGSFIDGTKIRSNVIVPIEIELVDDEREDGQMPPLFVVPALVVRRDFADALTEIGVDTIDYYPAMLVDRRRNKKWDDYLVGNVVGLVDAIDMQKSTLDPDSPPTTAMRFETMVINKKKCRGHLLFRLMHRQNLIIISSKVSEHLSSKKFPFFHPVAPEDFA